MKQLHDDIFALVGSDPEQELLEPATPLVLASVQDAFDALPGSHPLRQSLKVELITMEQISGAGDPIRLADLLPIVGQLMVSLPGGGLASPASRHL